MSSRASQISTKKLIKALSRKKNYSRSKRHRKYEKQRYKNNYFVCLSPKSRKLYDKVIMGNQNDIRFEKKKRMEPQVSLSPPQHENSSQNSKSPDKMIASKNHIPNVETYSNSPRTRKVSFVPSEFPESARVFKPPFFPQPNIDHEHQNDVSHQFFSPKHHHQETNPSIYSSKRSNSLGNETRNVSQQYHIPYQGHHESCFPVHYLTK